MALIVQKFGGTSVGTIERIAQVADKVKKFRENGDDIVVVVSAMSGETNRLLGLAKVNRTAPIAHRIEGKQQLDMDSAMAILNNRFQIMAQYRKLVIVPLVRQELSRADATLRHQLRRAKRLLTREPSLLQQEQQAHIDVMLAQSQALKVIYEKRLALQQIWSKTSANGHDMLAAIKQWVHEAEASGIQSLRDFAEHLRTYSLRPSVTPA